MKTTHYKTIIGFLIFFLLSFCVQAQNNNMITICHVPPGNPDSAVTIVINKHAMDALLAQGSYLGPCRCETAGLEDLIRLRVAPNPYQDQTTIEYEVKQSSNVSVNIISSNGNVVESVPPQEKVPGIYKISFTGNGNGQNNKMYMVRVAAHNELGYDEESATIMKTQ